MNAIELKTLIINTLGGRLGLYKFPDSTQALAVAVLPDEELGFEYPGAETEVRGMEAVIISPTLKSNQLLSSDLRKTYTWEVHLKDWDSFGAKLDECLDLLVDAFQEAGYRFSSPIKVQGSEALRIVAQGTIRIVQDFVRVLPEVIKQRTIVGFEAREYGGQEGHILHIPIVRTGDLSVTSRVVVSFVNDLAGPLDYETDVIEFEFAPGDETDVLQIELLGDEESDEPESFYAIIAEVEGAEKGLITSCKIGISNYQSPYGVFRFGATSTSVVEGQDALIPIQRVGGTYGLVTLDFEYIDATAEGGVDFDGNPFEIDIEDGENSLNLYIPTVLRSGYNGERTFILSLEGATNGNIANPKSISITILDTTSLPPAGQFSFVSTTASASQGGNLTIPMQRTGGSGGAVTVSFTYTALGAVAGTNYTAVASVVCADGQTSRNLVIPTIDIPNYQGEKQFRVTMSAVSAGTIGTQSQVLCTITDPSLPSYGVLRFSASSYSVSDSASFVAVTIQRQGGTDGAIDVELIALDDTAIDGVDYTSPSTPVFFSDGESQKVIQIGLPTRTGYQGNRSFNLTLFSPTLATLGTPYQAAVAITEATAPSPGIFAFSSGTYSIAEDQTFLDVEVVRTGGTDLSVQVDFNYIAGNAIEGVDYVILDDSITFSPGQASTLLGIGIIDRTAFLSSRYFDVQIAQVSQGTIGPVAATRVTITDTDAPSYGTFSFTLGTISASETAGTIQVQVRRLGGSDGAVNVNLIAVPGSALLTQDYTEASKTLEFSAGETTKAWQIPIVSRAGYQGDRSLAIEINSVTQGTIGSPASCALTILESSSPAYGTFGFSAASYSALETTGEIVTTINRTGGSDLSVTVSLSLTNGTGVLNTDYSAPSPALSVVFAQGETTKQVAVPIISRAGYQGNRSFTYTIASVSNGSIGGTSSAILTSLETTAIPYGSFSFSDTLYSVDDDLTTVAIDIERTNGSVGQVEVNLTATAGTAVFSTDYTEATKQLVFEDGDLIKTWNFPIIPRAGYQGDRVLTVDIVSTSHGQAIVPTSATVQLLEVTSPSYGTFAFSSATYSGNENTGTIPLTISRTVGSDLAVDATVTFTNGTALSGTDFTGTTQVISFANGETSKIVNVPVTNRANYQGDRTFTATISTVSNGTIGATNATTVTVVEVTAPSYGTFAFSSATYSASETAGVLPLTVNRTGGTDLAVDVTVTFSGGTAVSSTDYTGITQVISFANGETSKVVNVPIISRTNYQGDRTFNATITAVTNGAIGTQSSAVATILEASSPSYGTFAFSSATYSGNESAGTVPLTISRTVGSDLAVDATVTFTNGTALSGTDFTGTTQIISFANGETSKVVDVPVTNRTNYQGNRNFTATISTVSNGTIGAINATTVTVVEVSAPSYGTFAFSSATYSGNENAGTIPLTISRTVGSDLAVDATVTFTNGTATAGTDFTGTNQVISFANGETSKVVNVPVTNRTNYQGDRVFTATISTVSNGTIGGINATTVTVVEVSAPSYGTFQFNQATQEAFDDQTSVDLTITRTVGTDLAVSVTVTFTNGTALSGTDFTGTTQVIAFANGETFKVFQVPITVRTGIQGDRAFTGTISTLSNGTIGAQNTIAVTIRETTLAPDSEDDWSGLVYNWDMSLSAQRSVSGSNLVSLTDPINGVVLTQGTAADQPQYSTTDWVGGRSCAIFVGNDHINTNNALSQATGASTFFLVLKRGATGNNFQFGGPNATASPAYVIRHPTSNNPFIIRLTRSSGTVQLDVSVTVGNYAILVVGLDITANIYRPTVFHNRGRTTSSLAAEPITAGSVWRSGMRLGSSGGAATGGNTLAQGLIYNRLLTVNETQEVAEFLATKWGIYSSLFPLI